MENDGQSAGKQQIRRGTGKSDDEHLLFIEDRKIHGHGLRPAKVHQERHNNRPEKADMGDRIQCQAAHSFSRVVSEPVRRPGMSVFMDRQRYQKDTQRKQINQGFTGYHCLYHPENRA